VFYSLFVFIFYINNSIQNTGDISKLTQIPLIGVVGLNKVSELAVLTDLSRLCQSLSELFALPFSICISEKMWMGQRLLVTSSVSGRKKHFVA
jgi:hypothetical protein